MVQAILCVFFGKGRPIGPGWMVRSGSFRQLTVPFAMLRALILLLSAGSLTAQTLDTSLVRESGPLSPEEELRHLKVPDGFEIQLFAAEPQVNKPINMAFDEKGRMWVSSSYEYPYGAPRERWVDQEGSRVRDSRDGIFILEDTDGDGRADKKTVFADGLNIPTGVLPYKNGCIAWSIPNIWYFEDTDGDDRCDKRTVLFGPLGWEKDVHGNCSSFRLGPDGWVYGTHGFSNTSHFKVRPEHLRGAKPGDPGTELKLNSGNVYRFLPDGSRIELFTAGQVNPFGLAWDRWGHLYSADCHSAPVYQLIPGAVYPSFGKPHDGLGFGPVMIQHTHSSTGICGIVYLDGGVWGPEWNDRTLIGNVVTSRVNQDRITSTGSTPTAHEEADFITSGDPWFRPVDLRLGPAGELYVADFYNKVIGHYEVPLTHPGRDKERGRIWRVVRKSGAKAPVPPGGAVADLRFAARAGVLSGGQLEQAGRFLQSADAQERRAGVEALLRPVSLEWLPRLMALFNTTPVDDASLRHLLRIVIREHLRLAGSTAVLERVPMTPEVESEMLTIARAVGSPEAARFVFGRMSQNPRLLADTGPALTQLALQMPVDELVDFVRTGFAGDAARQADLLLAIVEGVQQRGELPPSMLLSWGNQVAAELLAGLPDGPVPAWTNLPLVPATASPWGLESRTMADGKKEQVISSLASGLVAAEQATGTLVSRSFKAPAKLSFALCGHDGDPGEAAGGRNFVRLVDAASGMELKREVPPRNDVARQVSWNLENLDGRPVRLETTDGDSGGAYAWLAVGRFEPPVVKVDTFQSEAAGAGRLAKLASLLKYAAPPVLRDRLAVFLPPAPPPPPSTVTPEQRAEADRLILARATAYRSGKPDKTRGQAVFTTHCAVCHAIGGKGALVGPQLDGIGNRGVDRLMEDILDPGRNVDSHFRLHVITRQDGSVLAGLERGELGQVLIVVDAAGQEQRLPKSDIKTNEETAFSLMPAAFGASIPEADFQDMLAWLLAQRSGL